MTVHLYVTLPECHKLYSNEKMFLVNNPPMAMIYLR